MKKFQSIIALILTLICGNSLRAESRLNVIPFKGITSKYIYAVPCGWSETSSLADYLSNRIFKFISDDGKQECYLRLIAYSKEKVTENDLKYALLDLNLNVFGYDIVGAPEKYSFDYDLSPTHLIVSMAYNTDHGEGAQMVEFVYKMSTDQNDGIVCILVKRNERVMSMIDEYNAVMDFIKNVLFLD